MPSSPDLLPTPVPAPGESFRGVFSTQTQAFIGFGATKRKVKQNVLVFAEEQPDGSFILRPYAEQLSPGRAPEGSDIHAVFNGYVSIGKVKSMVL